MGGGSLTDQSQFLPLHTRALLHHTSANRVFAVVYLCAILALLYHHFLALLHTTTVVSLLFLLADAVLAFMWATAQAFRMCPTQRQVFIEHLQHVAKESDYPALDVFICTADPYKEPPISVVNTALSVMAYDYPTEKLSVYVSDDGGSQLTLFAFMEAARFATHWLPYCRKNKILERCPEAYFESNPSSWFPEADQIKLMYEKMRVRVETAVKSGIISHDYINSKQELEAFSRWTDGFTSQNHPAVIQVLLECGKDEDVMGHTMPNLVYVSRGKSINLPHNFKAGALNALMSDPWFFVYIFCFLGAYGQDYLELILSGGTTQRWWNNQRVWMMRGLSSFSIGSVEYILKSIGISTFGFNVTSKAVEEEQSKRYKKGMFEFGVASPLFLPLTTAAIINLVSFLWGIAQIFRQGRIEDLLLQILLVGFAMVNCWPIYEAMVLRADEAKMPVKITLISIVLAWALYLASSIAF